MLHSYTIENKKIVEFIGFKENALWYDYMHLKESDKHAFEEKMKIHIADHKKIGRIGISNPFYKHDHTLYMKALMIAHADTDPTFFPITIILNTKYMLTLRDTELKPFQTFKKVVLENEEQIDTPIPLFLDLLETIVGRISELTEKISIEVDTISKETFKIHAKGRSKQLSEILSRLGKKEDLTAKIKESLNSLERLLSFFKYQMTLTKENQNVKETEILQQDMNTISQHLTFLVHKINFLLDATLGYISVEQNGITKSFTTVAVVFLPPTLIATIYGMNFHQMPELKWEWGYPIALALILLSAICPFLYFKKKGWL